VAISCDLKLVKINLKISRDGLHNFASEDLSSPVYCTERFILEPDNAQFITMQLHESNHLVVLEVRYLGRKLLTTPFPVALSSLNYLSDTPILHFQNHISSGHCNEHINQQILPEWTTEPYLLIWRLFIDDICPMIAQLQCHHSTLL
jgi:hypothetical protein